METYLSWGRLSGWDGVVEEIEGWVGWGGEVRGVIALVSR